METDRQVQEGIDRLLDPAFETSDWLPPKPPQVLGELMESRYMLPLLFPSDPQSLRAVPLDPHELSERNEEPNTPTPLRALDFRYLPLNVRAVEFRVINLVDGEGKRDLVDSSMTIDNTTVNEEEEVDTAGDSRSKENDEDEVPKSPLLTNLHPQPSLARKARVSATE